MKCGTIAVIILMVVTCTICAMYSDRLAEPVTVDVIIHDSNTENLPSVMGTETMNHTKTEQDMRCTYNVTTRHVHATTVAVEKEQVLNNLNVCICSLRLPARNTHAPYCHLWSAPLYNIFPHYLIKGTI